MTDLELRGRIFDGHSDAVVPGAVVVDQSSGRIREVRTGNLSSSPSTGSRLLTTDGTILPGFVDCHIHLIGAHHHDLTEWTLIPPVISGLRCVRDLVRLIEAGFTSVRDLGSKVGPSLRQAVDEGDLLGPRVITSGRSLAETGGDDDLRILPDDFARALGYSVYCDGPWECRKAVRQVVREGANVIKVYASGSFLQGGEVRPQLTHEEIAAIVAEAHKMGLRVAAHAYREEAIRTAVEAGVDSIEHGIGITEDVCELMRKKGVYYVPTLSVYHRMRSSLQGEKAALVERHFTKDISLALASELRIVTGTDFAGVDAEPHGQNHLEAVRLVEAGLKPHQALRAMTSEGAACLGVADLGVVREGALADLVLVAGHPETDIAAVAPGRVEHVVQAGRVVR
jgi:imidazolonepropionase-like amidohydrolase